MFFAAEKYNYPDDIFADSRMSFADHIGELQIRLRKALFWLVFFLIIGFILDSVGQSLGWTNFGVGRPVLRHIKEPFEEQVRDFYYMRNTRSEAKLNKIVRTDDAEQARIREKLEKYKSLIALTSDERAKLLGIPEKFPMVIPIEPLKKHFGEPKDPNAKEIELEAMVYPAHMTYLNIKGETALGNKAYMTTLSVQEGFVVYFKVSLICGVILASPMIFYQIWSFVSAGLYPHEKKHVRIYLPASIGLFLIGVATCQFLVLPGAIKALLSFNDWVDFDPDLRVNEFLSFAILLPLVFGISFQTPLVMLFMNRIGLFDWKSYLKKWRVAFFVLAVFSAVITPTPDAVTMLYLFVPMFGLYLLGIVIVYLFPARWSKDEAEMDAANVAV